jgi:hypothetical protein
MNLVNGFSPFQQDSGSTPGSSASLQSPATPRHEVEWHECSIDPAQLGLVDWTLKSKMQLQCHPDIWGDMSEELYQHHVQQEARQRFVSNSSARSESLQTENGSKQEAAALQWNMGLLYWQHPAGHQLPAPFFSSCRTAGVDVAEVDNGIGSSSKSKMDGSRNQQWEAPLAAASRFARESEISLPPVLGMARKAPAVAVDNGLFSFTQTRKREWQEAFRSLYCQWMERIRCLDAKWQSGGVKDVVIKDVTETYFYAIVGKGHTFSFASACKSCRETVMVHQTTRSSPKLLFHRLHFL